MDAELAHYRKALTAMSEAPELMLELAVARALTVPDKAEIPVLHPTVMLAIAQGICSSHRNKGYVCVCQTSGVCHAREIYRDMAISVVLSLKRAGLKLVTA